MGRRKKNGKSHVISIRISDKEREDLNYLMEALQIKRVSDLMRQAIGLVKGSSAGSAPKAIGAEPLSACNNFH